MQEFLDNADRRFLLKLMNSTGETRLFFLNPRLEKTCGFIIHDCGPGFKKEIVHPNRYLLYKLQNP